MGALSRAGEPAGADATGLAGGTGCAARGRAAAFGASTGGAGAGSTGAGTLAWAAAAAGASAPCPLGFEGHPTSSASTAAPLAAGRRTRGERRMGNLSGRIQGKPLENPRRTDLRGILITISSRNLFG